MSEFKMPTEIVELPSKGKLYPEGSELSKGQVEIKYMSAAEEDILTNQSYITKGTVFDKLLKSVIVSKINYDDLLIGDKNAIMVATRVLGYGNDYSFSHNGQLVKVDLSLCENKPLHDVLENTNINEFHFELPFSKNNITFKLLTHKDEQDLNREIEGLKKIHKDTVPELSTRLKYIITSVEGKREKQDVREFVDKYLLARDSRALRSYIKEIQPDVDLTYIPDSEEERIAVPIGVDFFWPDM